MFDGTREKLTRKYVQPVRDATILAVMAFVTALFALCMVVARAH